MPYAMPTQASEPISRTMKACQNLFFYREMTETLQVLGMLARLLGMLARHHRAEAEDSNNNVLEQVINSMLTSNKLNAAGGND